MTRKAKQMQMCKYMQYLIDEKGYNYCSLGEEIGTSAKSIREWIAKGNNINMQNRIFDKVYNRLEKIKKDIAETEVYNPHETITYRYRQEIEEEYLDRTVKHIYIQKDEDNSLIEVKYRSGRVVRERS